MATLSGQTIQSSYQGLLKLSDSTTGLTSTLQTIQDGLGNNTILKISNNKFNSESSVSYGPIKGEFYGTGYGSTSPQQNASGTQNILMCYPFYDKGYYSYSAFTVYVVTATSSSDTYESAIYNSQYINGFGLYPYEVVVSGITASTTSTGAKTYTFPSNISMSGYGSGIYWLVQKYSNSGVQPTVRFGVASLSPTALSSQGAGTIGITPQIGTPTTYGTGFRLNGNNMVLTGQTTFDNTFSTSLNTTQSSTASITTIQTGFILHTVM